MNNGKIDNCLNGIGSTHSVITTTRATSTIDVVDANLIHANKGVAALGVVVNYLVDDVSTIELILFLICKFGAICSAFIN